MTWKGLDFAPGINAYAEILRAEYADKQRQEQQQFDNSIKAQAAAQQYGYSGPEVQPVPELGGVPEDVGAGQNLSPVDRIVMEMRQSNPQALNHPYIQEKIARLREAEIKAMNPDALSMLEKKLKSQKEMNDADNKAALEGKKISADAIKESAKIRAQATKSSKSAKGPNYSAVLQSKKNRAELLARAIDSIQKNPFAASYDKAKAMKTQKELNILLKEISDLEGKQETAIDRGPQSVQERRAFSAKQNKTYVFGSDGKVVGVEDGDTR